MNAFGHLRMSGTHMAWLPLAIWAC